ncbi:hypothetical protein NOK12_27020 [Nocardioides sp. OK12]|nr:hypothetical protein NOK12_27020 [Nocardioides sp. OK12]
MQATWSQPADEVVVFSNDFASRRERPSWSWPVLTRQAYRMGFSSAQCSSVRSVEYRLRHTVPIQPMSTVTANRDTPSEPSGASGPAVSWQPSPVDVQLLVHR